MEGRAAAGAVLLRVAGPVATVRLEGDGDGEREALLPRELEGGPPVVGDEVDVDLRGGAVVVTAVRPRRTLLSRGEFGTARNRTRPLVANADLLLVVAAAADPPLRPRFVDRYLVAGELGGLEGAILITKADLPHDERLVARARRIYEDVGYPVLVGTTREPSFVAAVRDLVGDRVAALAGHSGVGKSSLTQAVTGVTRATGEVARAGTGRHTTTDPTLVPIPGGGALVDTAGVRNFYLPPMDAADLAEGFPEIAAAARACRFRGCRHLGEAGCAVPGRVTAERLESYRRLAALL